MTGRGPGAIRLPAFDGLRACAALTVLAYHVGLASGLSRGGVLAPLISELKAGVAVFFVISGCLLYLPYARAFRAGRELPDWRSFAERRAIRILPAYWVTLTVLALTPLGVSVITPNWWRYYALAQIYNPDTVMGGLIVAWSLCVEISFYVLLPLFARGMARLCRGVTGRDAAQVQWTVLLALAAGSFSMRALFARSALGVIPHSGFIASTSLPGFVDWFAAGMGLAVLAARWEADGSVLRRLRWLAARPECCWILGAAVFVSAALLQKTDLYLALYGAVPHLAQGVASALLVLPAVAPQREPKPGRVLRALEAAPMVWLGVISYGIYLWHVPLLEMIRGPLKVIPSRPEPVAGAAGMLVIVALGAVALGAMSWYLVERPAKRATQRARPAPALAQA
jgi:peptidoglycan/LPS O-acetylase OafA/YrhL